MNPEAKTILRDAIPIDEVARRYFELKKQGSTYMAVCPFHNEKTPSLSINPVKKGYHCFGCAVSGDIFTLTQKMESCNFPRAIEILCRNHGFTHLLGDNQPTTPVPTRRPRRRRQPYIAKKGPVHDAPASVKRAWIEGRTTPEIRTRYAKRIAERRGFQPETLLQLVEDGKISFPWLPWCHPEAERSTRGIAFAVEIVGRFLGYHQLWHPQKGRKSYLFVPYPVTQERAQTGYQRSFIGHDSLPPVPFFCGDHPLANHWIITEGQWDAIAIWECLGRPGINSGVSIFGLRGARSGESFLSHYKGMIEDRLVHVIPDTDEAGQTLFRSPDGSHTFWDKLRNLNRHTYRVDLPPAFKDFNDWYKAASPAEREAFVREVRGELVA